MKRIVFQKEDLRKPKATNKGSPRKGIQEKKAAMNPYFCANINAFFSDLDSLLDLEVQIFQPKEPNT